MAVAASVLQQPVLPVNLLYDAKELMCVVRACGPDFGPDHASLLELLQSFSISPFGTW
jgi:hypothetical protein